MRLVMKHYSLIKNNWYILKKVYKFNRLLFFLRIFVSILSSVSSITSILMPMYVIDAVLSDDIFNVIKVIFVFTIILLSIWVINMIFSWYDKVKMERLHISILSELMQKTINLDLSFFDDTTSYDKYNRAYANCCNVVNSVNSIISTFILSLTNTLLISSLLVWMDLYMYLLMFATIFLNLILTNLIKKRDYVYNFKVSEKNKQLNYIYRLFYIPQLIREVKTSNLSSFALGLKSNFDKCTIELIKANIKEKMPYQSVSGIWNLLESSFVALYFGVSVVLKKLPFLSTLLM